MITPSELQTTNDILDDDIVMITHDDGETETISGADLNKRNQTIIASGTTITGTPLKTGNVIRVLFTADITGSDTVSPLVINYNTSDKTVKVNKNGSLVYFVAANISSGVYKYLQAYTTLEMVYDGTQFIVIGNPVVISDTDYVIYANGKKIEDVVDVVETGNMRPVTSNAVAESLSYSTTEQPTGAKWIDGKPIYRKVIDFGALPNTGDKKVAHNISNLGDIIKYDCITTDGTIYKPVVDVGNRLMTNNITIGITQTEVGIQTGADKTAFTQTYVILEYTKTTD